MTILKKLIYRLGIRPKKVSIFYSSDLSYRYDYNKRVDEFLDRFRQGVITPNEYREFRGYPTIEEKDHIDPTKNAEFDMILKESQFDIPRRMTRSRTYNPRHRGKRG